MNKSKPYAAIVVKDVQDQGLARVMEGLEGPEVWVGIDVSKEFVMVVPCVGPGRFGRPWRVRQPSQLPALVALLTELSATRQVTVALEPTGTYADPLRWALTQAKLEVRRIETKASHDYAEVFDGVPSQHDGKDAALLAELAMHGKSTAWPLELKDERDSTMRALVEAADDQQRVLSVWTGRLEGLLARHWPEATETLGLDSATLLFALEKYGGPAALAQDAAADATAVQSALLSRGGHWLSAAKVTALIDGAKGTSGVPVNDAERERVAHCARSALAAMHELSAVKRKLAKLTEGDAVLERMSEVVGRPTACVLFTLLGSPLAYDNPRAYLKAAGLNPFAALRAGSGRAFQRQVPGTIEDQQARPVDGPQVAVHGGGAAVGNAGGRGVVRGQTPARLGRERRRRTRWRRRSQWAQASRHGPDRAGGVDAEAARRGLGGVPQGRGVRREPDVRRRRREASQERGAPGCRRGGRAGAGPGVRRPNP